MPSYRLSAQAEADLDDIWTFYAHRDAVEADLFTYKILEHCVLLSDQPFMGRERPELAEGLRSLALDKYVIFYRPSSNGVEIVRILHGSRDLEGLFGE